MSSEGVTRETWTGAVSCSVSEGTPVFGNLFLRQADADPVAPGNESPLVVDSVAWSADDPSALEITGRCDLSPGAASSLALALLRREGGQHRQHVDVIGGRFEVRLAPGSIEGGRPLEDGTWDVVLERREGNDTRIFAVPVTGELRAVYRLRGLWPHRTRVTGPGPAMVLSSERLDPVRVFGTARARFRQLRSVFGLRN
jgi:hypothetical protein